MNTNILVCDAIFPWNCKKNNSRKNSFCRRVGFGKAVCGGQSWSLGEPTICASISFLKPPSSSSSLNISIFMLEFKSKTQTFEKKTLAVNSVMLDFFLDFALLALNLFWIVHCLQRKAATRVQWMQSPLATRRKNYTEQFSFFGENLHLRKHLKQSNFPSKIFLSLVKETK